MVRILGTALAALMLATPLAALAQDVPSYAQAPQGSPGDEQIRGRITSFDGAFGLTVHDERGFDDNVNLHPGTIINPTGLTLAPGMVVSILGYNSGPDFSANEIDTPYSYEGGQPYYSGHRWDYYGPSIGLGFFFGNVGWWHGNDFRGGYSYDGGARYYNEVRVTNVYRGGEGYRGGDAYRGGVGNRGTGRYDAGTADRPRSYEGGAHQSGYGGGAQPRSYQAGAQQGGYQRGAQGNFQHGAQQQAGGHQDGGHGSGGREGGGHEGAGHENEHASGGHNH